MVLVGWIWINENARMAAFEAQFNARSIERGAALFATNCSSCHGVDGLGNVGRAPALNSPYMFGHDYLAEVNSQIATVQAELDAAMAATPQDQTAIDGFHAQMAELEASRASLIAQMGPAVNIGYDPESPARLARLGWTSTLRSFVYTTLVHGRPVSSNYWPEAMAAWAQTANGPLRADQLEDLTNFILNWDKGDDWTIDDLIAVRQFPIYPVDPATVVVGPTEPPVGATTELAAIMEGLSGVMGDPQAGQTAYNSAQLGCTGCHINAAVAPPTEGTWTRVQNERLTLPEFEGYTGEMYLAESIIHPNDFIVPPYPSGVMPANFGDRLSFQQLADLIAYMQTQDQ
jgi:mono/diheme cytochrome c family protein